MLRYKIKFYSIEGGSKMVEDAQIKTSVSPFAIREGEIKTFDGKDRICFYESNN